MRGELFIHLTFSFDSAIFLITANTKDLSQEDQFTSDNICECDPSGRSNQIELGEITPSLAQ